MTPRPAGQSCATCAYFEAHTAEPERDGHCHRFPKEPIALGQHEFARGYPAVRLDEWCGEFKR